MRLPHKTETKPRLPNHDEGCEKRVRDLQVMSVAMGKERARGSRSRFAGLPARCAAVLARAAMLAVLAAPTAVLGQGAADTQPQESRPASAIEQPAPAPATVSAPEPSSSQQPAAPDTSPPAGVPGEPAGAPPAPAAPSLPVIGSGQLPRDLSPWSMFMSADILVQSVMVGLVFASIVTWTVWLAKNIELWAALRRLRRGLVVMSAERSLADAHAGVSPRRGILPRLIDTAILELRLSSDIGDKAGIKERIAISLARLELAAGRDMNKGTGVLATIGATAPFVGLFGTVWGIMNSFIGISKAQTTNLAVVAPGIAEALLATAIGLFAAIPAVVIYNQFTRSIARYRALVGDASAEVLRLVSRDLDRGEGQIRLSSAAE
jgi:biopolymer transport protein ExbB